MSDGQITAGTTSASSWVHTTYPDEFPEPEQDEGYALLWLVAGFIWLFGCICGGAAAHFIN